MDSSLIKKLTVIFVLIGCFVFSLFIINNFTEVDKTSKGNKGLRLLEMEFKEKLTKFQRKEEKNENTESRTKQPLHFKDGEFTILQLTDLHYGENPLNDIASNRLVEKLIEKTNPDLVVITGDAVSGYSWNGKDQDFYKSHWHSWTKSMRRLEIPYAYTFGNLDDGADLTRKQIIELDKRHPYSYMMAEHGKSDYYLPIYSSNGQSVTAVLWMFDTMDENCMGVPNTWGCFEDLDWYDNESIGLAEEYGYMPKGLAFFHIPLPEYVNMHNESPSYGNRYEGINCPKANNGFFESILKLGNIKATFCGHDHSNDEGGVYIGVELVYGRKTGYGGYGPSNFQRGARVIKLKEGEKDFTYDHYVLQEDLTIKTNSNTIIKGQTDRVDGCVKV
jgi:hypothetical protein